MNKVDKLKEQIKFLNAQIKGIQEKCTHAPDDVELENCIEWGEISDGWNNGNAYPIYCTRVHCKACSLTRTLDRLTRPQYARFQKKTVEENKKKALKQAADNKTDARKAKAKKKPSTKKTATKKVAKKTAKRKA